jgi:hypothetical protein
VFGVVSDYVAADADLLIGEQFLASHSIQSQSGKSPGKFFKIARALLCR